MTCLCGLLLSCGRFRAAGWSAVCDCSISWSYSLTFSPYVIICLMALNWCTWCTDHNNCRLKYIFWVKSSCKRYFLLDQAVVNWI